MPIKFIKRILGGGGNANNARLIHIANPDPDITKLIEFHLGHLGYATSKAASADETLALLEQGQKPCLFLIDMAIPPEAGIALARTIRKMPAIAATPIIFLLTVSDPSDPDRVHAEIPNAHILPKPFCIRTLRLAVEAALKRQGSERRERVQV